MVGPGAAEVARRDGYLRRNALTKTFVNLPDHNPAWPFSDGVMLNGTLYLSGRIGVDPATGKVPESPEEEARFLMEQFVAVLQAAEMTMDDLVYVTIYCPDVAHWGAFNSVYVKYFKGPNMPARAFLGSGPLLFGARFEMQAIAAKG